MQIDKVTILHWECPEMPKAEEIAPPTVYPCFKIKMVDDNTIEDAFYQGICPLCKTKINIFMGKTEHWYLRLPNGASSPTGFGYKTFDIVIQSRFIIISAKGFALHSTGPFTVLYKTAKGKLIEKGARLKNV